jgi:hypothetical protein
MWRTLLPPPARTQGSARGEAVNLRQAGGSGTARTPAGLRGGGWLVIWPQCARGVVARFNHTGMGAGDSLFSSIG